SPSVVRGRKSTCGPHPSARTIARCACEVARRRTRRRVGPLRSCRSSPLLITSGRLDSCSLFVNPRDGEVAQCARRIEARTKSRAPFEFFVAPELHLDAEVSVIEQFAADAVMAGEELEKQLAAPRLPRHWRQSVRRVEGSLAAHASAI